MREITIKVRFDGEQYRYELSGNGLAPHLPRIECGDDPEELVMNIQGEITAFTQDVARDHNMPELAFSTE